MRFAFTHWRGVILAALLLAGGCSRSDSLPEGDRTSACDRQCREKWGKPLSELPTLRLVAISANNENIQDEFEWAFSLHHAVAYGQKVDIEWRNVGGGGSAILQAIQADYQQKGGTSGIDVLWGGGDSIYVSLAAKGYLQPLRLPADVLANIPEDFGGVTMYGPPARAPAATASSPAAPRQISWIGSAISGFGFLYNTGLLRQLNLPPPRQWEDLGAPRYLGLVTLVDPTQSASAVAAYEMVLQSSPDWPSGWAKLLAILGNARTFTDGAGFAANAPVLGESVAATSIDLFGVMRVAEAPDQLAYVSPAKQTAFTPDPIAILKNPPHPELAQRFIDFVLSPQGQALWALRPGEEDGPVRRALCRQPIRRDVYELYAGRMMPETVNPYRAGQAMALDLEVRNARYSVLKLLVQAAAIDNLGGLRAAKKKLIATHFDPARLAEFNRLPEDVATLPAIIATSKRLEDETEAERVVTDWTRFFREKYRRVAEGTE